MSIIDWSDPEEMLGLLIEYVQDEALASEDVARLRFLTELSRELAGIADQCADSPEQIEAALRELCDSQDEEFANDRVMVHVRDCLEEVERIASDIRK